MRRTIIVVATLLLTMAVYVANFTMWASREIIDEDAFVAATLGSLVAEGSTEALADIITARVIERDHSLIAIEPTINEIFEGLVGSEDFAPALAAVTEQVHRVVVGGDDRAVTVDLGAYRDVILVEVEAVSPALAVQIPEAMFSDFVVFETSELPDASVRAESVDRFAVAAVVVAMILSVVMVLYLRSGPTWLAATGTAFTIAGAATALMIPFAREASKLLVPTGASRAVGVTIYDSLVAGLATRSWILVIVGLVMIAVALGAWGVRIRTSRAVPAIASDVL